MILLLALAATTGFGTSIDDDWPPLRWRGTGSTYVIYVKTQREVDRLCGKAPKGFFTEACSYDDQVILPDPCTFTGEEYARIVCHENGHRFAGWPWDHPL